MSDAITDPENTLILETVHGNVVIECLPDKAPGHVARLKELAREGFYDGIIFHRVIDGFMAQTGCPQGTGTGNSDKPDLPAEFNDVSHQRGVCSMARSQMPDSANSQFGGDGSEMRLGPVRATEQGWLTIAQVRTGAVSCFCLAGAAGIYLVVRGGWPILLAGLASIVAGW